MAVNSKISLRLKNNTKYFNEDTSRAYNRFSSPNSYQSRQIKIEGYETRLYWQYRYCEEHSGQTFFYTLTYNDEAMPHYYDVPCFDYNDLRYLLTGGFYQRLRREYGTKLRYFVGAELGDGKGKRGLHLNPHYHILFFLEPDDNPLVPYKKISPEDFRHLVRIYWQGFDEDKDGYQDYRTAKFGIAREGDNLGLVTDYRACCYCAKYVTKDVKLKAAEDRILQYSFAKHSEEYDNSKQSFIDFFKEFVGTDIDGPDWELNAAVCFGSVPKLEDDYWQFVQDKIALMVHDDLILYRNRYCNKCRISQHIGDYALKFIDDKLNPTVQVPSKKGFKNRPLPLFLYRKLYTRVVNTDEVMPDGEVVRHSPIRVLNDLGIEFKVAQLPKRIKKLAQEARNNFRYVANDAALYRKMHDSDCNGTNSVSRECILALYKELLAENNNNEYKIFTRYAEYKLVYEDRFFAVHSDEHSDGDTMPPISLLDDYRRFLVPAIYSTPRSDTRLDEFLQSGYPSYLSYSLHPYFFRYTVIFDMLDMCADYFFVQDDNKKQKEAEELAATKRFHDREKLKDFYRQFTNC